jgi:hypothetical protein
VTVSGIPGEELLEAPDEAVEAVSAVVETLSDPLIEKTGGGVVGEVENASESVECTVVEVFEYTANIDDVEAGVRTEFERGRETSAG